MTHSEWMRTREEYLEEAMRNLEAAARRRAAGSVRKGGPLASRLAAAARWMLLATGVAMLALIAVSAGCQEVATAAPAPLPRKAKGKPTLPPSCTMTWGTHKARANFLADGSYRCEWYGATYVGTWRLDQNTDTLWIVESANPEYAETWATYKVKMKACRREGTLSGEAGDWSVPFAVE